MKLSAVIQLIDGFSMAPAVGARAHFLLNDKPIVPQDKAQAFYAFAGLDDGSYRLDVLSADHRYFDQQLTFEVPLKDPLADAIVACVLAPSPLYPYPEGTTLIRGKIVDAAAQPLAQVAISAGYQGARARAQAVAGESSGYGRYAGRYALALRGKLDEPTTVALGFSKAGHAKVSRQVSVQPGSMLFLDIEMP
ncbi:carboxypeptidase-like regulatory domain-containing protein [Janthinobacterium lividum]|uniref:Carboxypeptidase regulatory-like domain-containing protein n=1 Tax=Janthinobacterium lividum TaxID=29581 RepID=A0ABU0Y257_9BURK|nr:carboxypeptidase-like regulatory domain-containing protein [Janthinobacterium lividum]MBR7632652.1 carboxypeptidase regulatory-like domain-containing protein [Janthinobacterium lividum]MDQ4629838.1 carboxypeptidase regulatory-like domain-containing protein [Janthinobacterium lividum]MDQ4677971.1 carboxypeptidase regulatory-like domain-containing protein [Janthinobacterium lividum]MDQ4688165.1 carboxypeptidase regulatory-like domain-containing protein [Janthinobacterium lividum]